MKKKILAGVFALVMGCSACAVPAYAEETVATDTTTVAEETTVNVERSSALYYTSGTTTKALPESQIKGTLTFRVKDHDIHVKVVRYSSEAPVTYYDMDLTAAEDGSVINYVLDVNYSECPSDASAFATVYQSAYLENIYSSSYTVTITTPESVSTMYEDTNVIIADPNAESDITGKTNYSYELNYVEDETAFTESTGILASSTSAVSEEGNLEVTQNVDLLWKPYIIGDVNSDKKIDISDAFLVLQYATNVAAGLDPGDAVLKEAADVNADGDITLSDAFEILNFTSMVSAGTISTDTTMEEYMASKAEA